MTYQEAIRAAVDSAPVDTKWDDGAYTYFGRQGVLDALLEAEIDGETPTGDFCLDDGAVWALDDNGVADERILWTI